MQLRSSLLVIALIALWGCHQGRVHRSAESLVGFTMGTSYTVKYTPGPQSASLSEIAARVEAELESVNAQMSTYREDSELSQFNRQSSVDWFPVSVEVAEVAALALHFHQQTEGLFDVTVGPLVDLWGFGPQPRPERTPQEDQIQQILKSVGSDKLEVRLEPAALRKLVPDLRVDLSAIAKGHGVDRLAEVLDDAGVDNYFVEIGGEVRVKGHRLDGRPWQIGIERPDDRQRAVHRVIGLTNLAMATSGDYRNLVELDDSRFSHFIDPRTGRPAVSDVASATVLADDCASADALATGLASAGSEKALELINRHGWPAMLVVRRQDRLETVVSDRFAELAPAISE